MEETQNNTKAMDMNKSARTDNSTLDVSAHSGASGPPVKKARKKKIKLSDATVILNTTWKILKQSAMQQDYKDQSWFVSSVSFLSKIDVCC